MTPEQQQVKEALDKAQLNNCINNVDKNWNEIVSQMKLEAKLLKAEYNAFIDEGFDATQALMLIIERWKYIKALNQYNQDKGEGEQ